MSSISFSSMQYRLSKEQKFFKTLPKTRKHVNFFLFQFDHFFSCSVSISSQFAQNNAKIHQIISKTRHVSNFKPNILFRWKFSSLFLLNRHTPFFLCRYTRKLLFPSLLFNSILFTSEVISSCVLTLGFTYWCRKLKEDVEHGYKHDIK